MLASTTQTIIIYDSKTNRNCAATHYLMCLREIRSVPKAPPRPISQPSPYFGTLASAALQVISVPKMLQPTKRSGDHPSPHRRTFPKAGQSQSCDLRSTLVQCITVFIDAPTPSKLSCNRLIHPLRALDSALTSPTNRWPINTASLTPLHTSSAREFAIVAYDTVHRG